MGLLSGLAGGLLAGLLGFGLLDGEGFFFGGDRGLSGYFYFLSVDYGRRLSVSLGFSMGETRLLG